MGTVVIPILDPIPLPITLLSFSGSCDNNGYIINWTTASEVNVSHFELMKFTNNSWDKLADISAKGNSYETHSYQFIDRNITENVKHIYQLKIVDFDSSMYYSEIFMLSCDASLKQNKLQVYPNPIDDELTIVINNGNHLKEIELHTISGKLMYKDSMEGSFKVIKTSHLVPGVYILKVGEEYKRIIKN